MEFNKAYNRQEFVHFLQHSFLPEDFVPTEEPVTFQNKMTHSTQAIKLGTSAELDLVVYEVRHTSKNDARVSLSKDAFRMLADEMEDRALVIFVPEDNNDNYRFSLIEITLEGKDDSSRITRNYSNPRRYSYYLGEGIACHTPQKYLNPKNRVTDYKDLKDRFSVEVLTDDFYEELANWYFWALKPECNVSFPNDINDDTDDKKYNTQNLIRLITRLIFVWFLRQKGLVPKDLFDKDTLNNIIKDFKPDDINSGKYYRAILQNLFFATLNRKIEERSFIYDDYKTNRANGTHNIKTFMRHASDLSISKEQFITLLRTVPFMNNSLFECLDNKEQQGHKYNWDGFSESNKPQRQSVIPNKLFFADEVVVDLSKEYDRETASKTKVYGLLNILKRYNFTVEESTPLDQDVALDPELLGKVFENLLAAYNPETRDTVRKSTGSYYTPRNIVQYMVDKSIVRYIKKAVPDIEEDTIRYLLSYDHNENITCLSNAQTKAIMAAILNCKVLDPACGSGAFPMGMLQQLSHLLSRLDEKNQYWEEIVMNRLVHDVANMENMNEEEKEDRKRNVLEVFRLSLDNPEYTRKLYIIENCIYGVDLQSIAVQISRLRFFISLLCEQQPDLSKPENNYNIKPLPNLEMKFVCANTLMELENIDKARVYFANEDVVELINQLKTIRHASFIVTNNRQKEKLRSKDETLRNKIRLTTGECCQRAIEEKIKVQKDNLANLLKQKAEIEKMSDELVTNCVATILFAENESIDYSPKIKKMKIVDGLIKNAKQEISKLEKAIIGSKDKAMQLARQLTDWNPYDQNVTSPYFDTDWMFGVKDGFDVIIGNPPYINSTLQSADPILKKQREAIIASKQYETLYQKWDLYIPFMEFGCKKLAKNGVFSMIVPYPLSNQLYAKKYRKWVIDNYNVFEIADFNGTKIFENASVFNVILFAQNCAKTDQLLITHINKDKQIYSAFSQSCERLVQDSKSLIWNLTQEERNGLRHPNFNVLGDFCYVSYGLRLNSDEKTAKGEFVKADLLSETEDTIHCRKLIEGKDIEKYHIKKFHYVEWDTPRCPEKLVRPTFREFYNHPKIFCNYLGNLAATLDFNNHFIHTHLLTGIVLWRDLHGVDNKSIQSSIKKFSRYNRNEMESMSKEIDLRFLLGILNSSYATVLLRDLRGGDYHIYPEHIRNIPIAPATDEQQQQIANLVDGIVATKSTNPNADTSLIEQQIDNIVYHLYELTYDEVLIVDPETPITREEYSEH